MAIYSNINSEFRRFEKLQEIILEKQVDGFNIALHRFSVPPKRIDLEMIQAARMRLISNLLIINLAILAASAVAGYFLAGRTLRPIKQMMDEQNRFISDASHELKTPLTSLKTALEVYLRNKNRTKSEADRIVAESITEVNNLQTLSESLLSLAQFDNKATNGFTNFDISESIEDAVKKVSAIAKKHNIKLNIKVENAFVKAQKHMLSDLFVILFDNAIKYSLQKSTITVRAKKTDGYVEVLVTDQGIGIDEKDIPFIFDRFYRADTSRSKHQANGYGLGLSIAKKILDIHNGTISVTSKLGSGSTFTIKLPTIR